MKLFCLSYAGGTTSFYDELESYLRPDIEVIKLEYAGHGKRHMEACYKNFDELSEDIFPQIIDLVKEKERYALMGYSMGSISVAVILKHIIEETPLRLPCHVFLAAHEPETKKELMGYSSAELDVYVKERTIRFGGIPEKLLNSKAFWRVYLPIYRADYSMIADFNFDNFIFHCDVPATVFYSETDTPRAKMEKWKNYFKYIEYIEYSGTHFFINEWCGDMATRIKDSICE